MGDWAVNFAVKMGMRQHVQAIFHLANAQPKACIEAVQNDPALISTLQRFHVLLATKVTNLKEYQLYFMSFGRAPKPALEQPVDMASVLSTYETVLIILGAAKNNKLLISSYDDLILAQVTDNDERVRLYKETEIYKMKLYSSNMAGCLHCRKVVLAANTDEERQHAGKEFQVLRVVLYCM